MSSKLVVALDIFDAEQAIDISRKIGKEVFAVKINWPLIMVHGSSVISEIAAHAKVICDLKVADIPNTNSLIAGRAAEEGAWGIISHSFVGSDSLKAVVEASGDVKVFSVVAMSHPGASELIYPNHDRLIQVSREVGVYGLIAPANDYEMLRQIRKKVPELKILAPGVGAQGGSAREAIRNGADYVIAGRIVYRSENPIEEVRKLNSEILAV